MKKLSATVCAVTHAGRVRNENEDNYSLNGKLTSTGELKKGSAFVQKMAEPFHLIVCDGMGGESYGELASGIAVETLSKNVKDIYSSGEDFSFAISNSLDEANERICKEITARGARMGSTLAAIYAMKGSIVCVNIGDTRIYRYSKGLLEQVSFDHTHAQSIIDIGGASLDKIGDIPDAKKLTKHLGVFPEESNLSPNISVINDVDDGDIIMLCSDGLTDMLSDAEINSIISTGESAQDVSGKLIRKALEKGGKDNITVMTAFIGAEDTAVFTPKAAAVVGDRDADYEEEYRNSFGTNNSFDTSSAVSPYANADARAYEDSEDTKKVIKIAAIVTAALVILIAAIAAIKIIVTNRAAKEANASTQPGTTYNYQSFIPGTASSEIVPWNLSTTAEVSSTEEPTTEKETERETQRRSSGGSSSKKTTRKQTTTYREKTTSEEEETTASEVTTVPSTTATQPQTEPTQPQTEPTQPQTEPVTQPQTEPTQPQVEPTQPDNDDPQA